jgi:hypothetical protein
MNPERLSTYLTVGANIAVLVGLVFVGVEVRNSNATIAAQTSYNVTEGFNTLNMSLANNPTLLNMTVIGGREPDKLTDEEAAVYVAVIRSYVNQYVQVYRLMESGAISESNWALYAREAHQWLSSPGPQLFVEGNEIGQLLFDAVQPYGGDESTLDDYLGRQPDMPE